MQIVPNQRFGELLIRLKRALVIKHQVGNFVFQANAKSMNNQKAKNLNCGVMDIFKLALKRELLFF